MPDPHGGDSRLPGGNRIGAVIAVGYFVVALSGGFDFELGSAAGAGTDRGFPKANRPSRSIPSAFAAIDTLSPVNFGS